MTICGRPIARPVLCAVALYACFLFAAGCDTTPTSEGAPLLPPITDSVGFAADTAAVRAILDSNGYLYYLSPYISALYAIDGYDTSGRVTALDFSTLPNISHFPPQIGNLPNLLYLDMSHLSLLTSLPGDIGRLSRLTKLNASHTGIRSISPAVFNCSQLTTLYLFNDSLSGLGLPPAIGRLSNLSDLEIEYNQLTNLPDSIVSIQTTGRWANVSHNCLGVQPDSTLKWLDEHSYDANWQALQDGCP